MPYPFNKRISFPETVEKVLNLSISLGKGQPTKILIEDVGYQRSLVEELIKHGYPAEGVKVLAIKDKANSYLTQN